MFKLLESVILHLACTGSYRYLCHVRGVGQRREPRRGPWRGAGGSGPPTPLCTALHSRVFFTSVCLQAVSFAPRPSVTFLDTPAHSYPASKPFSLSFFFSIFSHLVVIQFTSPKAHHEGSFLVPLSPCPLPPSPEGTVPPGDLHHSWDWLP